MALNWSSSSLILGLHHTGGKFDKDVIASLIQSFVFRHTELFCKAVSTSDSSSQDLTTWLEVTKPPTDLISFAPEKAIGWNTHLTLALANDSRNRIRKRNYSKRVS